MELPDEESEFSSSAQEMRDFLKSHIWHDLQRELQTWKADILTQLAAEKTYDMLRELQGNLITVERMLGLPEWILQVLESLDSKMETTDGT